MAGGGTKAVVAALLANGGIAISKFVGFGLTGSASMLAEGVHSVADTGNQALLLLGGKRAQREATTQHPFGYGRERYFWSFVVALILFSLGGMFAIYEGWHKISDPHDIDSPSIALGILGVAILLEAFSFRTAIVESLKVKAPEVGWWAFIRRSKQPELPVVLLEDLGAMIGLVVAFGAVLLSVVTDDPIYDGFGTLTIGVLLVIIAVILAIEMKGLLMGESASDADQQAIAAAIEIDPSVQRLIHMRTQHIGPDELLVGAKIELVDGLDVREVVDVVNNIEIAIRRAVPSARIMYLEPDIFRTEVPDDPDAAPMLPTPDTAAEAKAADGNSDTEAAPATQE